MKQELMKWQVYVLPDCPVRYFEIKIDFLWKLMTASTKSLSQLFGIKMSITIGSNYTFSHLKQLSSKFISWQNLIPIKHWTSIQSISAFVPVSGRWVISPFETWPKYYSNSSCCTYQLSIQKVGKPIEKFGTSVGRIWQSRSFLRSQFRSNIIHIEIYQWGLSANWNEN